MYESFVLYSCMKFFLFCIVYVECFVCCDLFLCTYCGSVLVCVRILVCFVERPELRGCILGCILASRIGVRFGGSRNCVF